MAIAVGTLLGRYEILGVIGRGSMGAVYEARDPKIDRHVAIKTIALIEQELSKDRKYRERLFQEARTAGRLSHPGIVTIFDVGEDPESHDPFIVMEYVAGQSLDRLMDASADKKLPLYSALQLVKEIAEGLNYAHTQGVIHRDIKPANILITKEGRAKIADFGIAKLSHADTTPSGHLIGSPAFMSPEQLAGEDTDGRADLFALGVILYTMLTGHRPFQGNSAATVAYKLMHRPAIPVTTFEAELPKELDEIVFRAIAKDPEERYQSGAEFAHAIEELQAQYGLVNTPIELQANSTNVDSGPARRQASVKRTLVPWHKKINTSFVWWGVLAVAVIGFLAIVIRPFTKSGVAATTQNSEVAVLPAPIPEPSSATVPQKPANLHIEIEYHFPNGQAAMWLDAKQIYVQTLKGSRVKRRLVFHETKGTQSVDLPVASGKHDLRVRVKSSKGDYSQSKTLSLNLSPGQVGVLHIACEPHQLKFDLH
ncbi:MAG TPA: serine/threonine-protein kinase [Terriglobales bacterium]|nr:serine/threonine-protein kinase [Terriglobales bacterium]